MLCPACLGLLGASIKGRDNRSENLIEDEKNECKDAFGVHAQGRFSIRTSTMTKKNRHKDALEKGRLGLLTLKYLLFLRTFWHKDVYICLCIRTFRHKDVHFHYKKCEDLA